MSAFGYALRASQAIAAIAVLKRLAPGAFRMAPVSANNASAAFNESVSVVIPARNEVGRIEQCLAGLRGQHVDEIIVVNDESSDNTAKVASQLGARVVDGKPLPKDWVGKPWALQQGLSAATSEWVLFLDADTVPRRKLVVGAIGAARRTNAHVLSLSARFLSNSVVEQTLHASMLATLIYRFGPTGTITKPTPDRTIINGQCVLVRREWLLAQGGFKCAAAHMTDDIAFARALAHRGAHVVFLDGSDVLDVRMHQSTADVWRQWGRSLPMSDVTTPRQSTLDLATVWLTMTLPLWRLITKRATLIDRVLIAVRFALCLPLVRSYDKPIPGVLLSPIADIASSVRLTEATLRPVRSWRGRAYAQTKSATR